ncbi:unnamed protein product [Periconia digitata]|uniref:Uncharacterized protein n=1 Tax=Periconia digitata TaxID=1303443 RepID=A0A9W4UFT2_9PLEO|nr:unnamed protein product [Periconia digitata]
MLLSGPPSRPLFIASFLLLFIFIGSHLRHNLTSPATLLQRTSPAPRSTTNPLDFSIPLQFEEGKPKPPEETYSWTVVVPKTAEEDLRWLEIEVPSEQLMVYEVDNPNAQNRVPKNKGKEAMVYLSYLIDHYDNLTDTIIFLHAHNEAWHNNELLEQKTVPMIKRLSHDRVARLGYMNLRCRHDPGCPDWLHLNRPGGDFDFVRKPEEIYWRRHIWEELHPGAPIPQSLSGVCCAQFALSRDRVRQVPIERLRHYRRWLLNTSASDYYSGRIFEYLWHYIFTGHEV